MVVGKGKVPEHAYALGASVWMMVGKEKVPKRD